MKQLALIISLSIYAWAQNPILTSGGGGGSSISTPVSVSNGGTGSATLSVHGVIVGNGTSAVAVTGAGTSGQVLTSNGASVDPTFQTPASFSVSTTLNAAAFLDLQNTPVTVLPAQGANTAIVLKSFTWEISPGSESFRCNDGISLDWSIGTASGQMDLLINGNKITFPNTGQIRADISTYGGTTTDLNNQPATVSLVSGNCAFGRIATSAVNAGGSGYAMGDTGTIDCRNNGNDKTTYTITSVSMGAVTAYTLGTDNGGAYAVTTGCSTSPTSGSGDGAFTIDINSVTKGNGAIYLTTDYKVIGLH